MNNLIGKVTQGDCLTVMQGMQFYFFNDDKICETCWGKLVIYYDEI